MLKEVSQSKPDRYCSESLTGGTYSTDRKSDGGCQGLGRGRGCYGLMGIEFLIYRVSKVMGWMVLMDTVQCECI